MKSPYKIIKVGMQLIPEHRLIAEEALDRQLTNEETIHHIDFNKKNNNIDNLCLFSNKKSHSHWHRQFNQFGWTRPLADIIDRGRITNQLIQTFK
jgi:hypothetical protein